MDTLHLNYVSEIPTADTNKEKLSAIERKGKKEGLKLGFKGQCRPSGAYVSTHVCVHVCAYMFSQDFIYFSLPISKKVSLFYRLNSFSMH